MIVGTRTPGDVDLWAHQVIGGTAGFAREELRDKLDYLFIDEAGRNWRWPAALAAGACANIGSCW